MFFHIILQVVFSLSFLSSFCVSSCGEECEDQPKFTPSRLVVKFGDPTSASCSVCQQACVDKFAGLEKNVGDVAVNGTTILWRVDSMTEWDTTPQCYYNSNSGQCCSSLPVIVYQPPENVSISLKSHTGPMFAGRQYTLQCTVQNVAPVENLSVTFYRGERKLGKSPSKDNKEKKPVTEIFTLSFSPSEEDDGVQYWCEAKLEFGLEGPQPPPVVTSQNITAAVYYKPQLKESSHLGIITIIEGNPLQLDCSAVGNPSPSYSWTLPTGSISPSGGSVLTIKSVTSADKGLYSCSVSNQVGTITVEFRVVVQREECEDQPKFTPSRLVVKFGDPTFASCSVCQQACVDKFAGLEKNVGDVAVNGTTILWTVDNMTEWDTTPQCYYNSNSGQCCSSLPVIVYQPPENVSISLKSHTGPMFAVRQYTLQCTVQNVAPVENLSVTFYRGERKLGKSQSKDNKEKKPVTEIFTLSFSPSKEDDGVQYWCEAKLEFGLEGPQPPPVVTSQNITATVYYKPQLKESSHLSIITIIEGNPLQLDCSAVGNPSPSYSWTLPTGSISPSGGSVLTIKSVTSADKGLYSCSVSNQVGTITVEFRVVVQRLELTSARLSTRLSPTTKPATPTRLTTRRTITTQTTTTRSSSTSSTLIHSHIVFYAFILYSGLS